jgi:hypothetical protein
MQSKKRKQKWYRSEQTRRILQLAGVLFLVVVFVIPVIAPTFGTQTTPPESTATLDPLSLPFPTVPPNGFPVVISEAYFHPTGLFSLPKLEGWDKPPATGTDQPEEVRVPATANDLRRAGVTFTSSSTGSVIHAFVEQDPLTELGNVQAFDKLYTTENLNSAWTKYTSWRELERHVEGDLFVINFELRYNEQTYLGRQISRLDHTWNVVLRLVTPNNDPQLMEDLQRVLVAGFQFYPRAATVPINWATIADSGYMIRYPPDWRQLDGSPNHPYTISGKLGQATFTLLTHSFDGQVKTEADVRAWVQTTAPNAKVLTVQAESVQSAPGFSVSYTYADADGKRYSVVAMLLNSAKNTVAVASLQTDGERDLLKAGSAPAELDQIRGTFFLPPLNFTVPPPAPTPTPTPTPAG